MSAANDTLNSETVDKVAGLTSGCTLSLSVISEMSVSNMTLLPSVMIYMKMIKGLVLVWEIKYQ